MTIIAEFDVSTSIVKSASHLIHGGQSIFYIPEIDTYVQFDGVYWHGLDRPLEEIAKYKTKRDVQIYKKWLSDREQDRWFKEQGMKLVRITDIQYLKERDVCINENFGS